MPGAPVTEFGMGEIGKFTISKHMVRPRPMIANTAAVMRLFTMSWGIIE
jgi:hypothetical protein